MHFALTNRIVTTALLVLGCPLAAFALGTSPAAILASFGADTAPRDFSFEVHANNKEYYLSLWAKGSTEGLKETLKVQETITLDMASPTEQLQGRVKLKLLIAEQTLYVSLDSLEGDATDVLGEMTSDWKPHQWMAVPLDASTYTEQLQDEDPQALLATAFEALFNVRSSAKGNTTEYAFTLKRDFLRSLERALKDSTLGAMLPEQDASSMRIAERMILSHTKVRLGLVTDAAGLALSSSFAVSFSVPEEHATGNVSASMTHRNTPVTFALPTNTVSPESILGSVDLEMFGSMVPWAPANEGTLEDYTPDTLDCTSDLSKMRKGLCGPKPLRPRS